MVEFVSRRLAPKIVDLVLALETGRGCNVYRQRKTILQSWLAVCLLLLLSGPVWGSSFTFNGNVLYDSSSSWGRYPGYNDSFSGTVDLENGLLNFENLSTGSRFDDFGEVTGGFFTQGGIDYYYALSSGSDGRSQMGVIWWSQPVNLYAGSLTGNNYFRGVSGLAFYLEGPMLYTPAQMIAMRLQSYLETGVLPSLYDDRWNTLYMTGCRLDSGRAFFGLLESELPVQNQDSSAVPLPPSVWLLGSGVFGFLALRRKQKV